MKEQLVLHRLMRMAMFLACTMLLLLVEVDTLKMQFK